MTLEARLLKQAIRLNEDRKTDVKLEAGGEDAYLVVQLQAVRDKLDKVILAFASGKIAPDTKDFYAKFKEITDLSNELSRIYARFAN